MDKKKVKGIILNVVTVVIILCLLGGLGYQIYMINYNYRKYEFKLNTKTLDIVTGSEVKVPIELINDESIDYSDYVYSSGDENIVSINDNGDIVALKRGSTIIVIKSKKSYQKEVLNVSITGNSNM